MKRVIQAKERKWKGKCNSAEVLNLQLKKQRGFCQVILKTIKSYSKREKNILRAD
jgi:hypothetical protein